MAAGDNTRGGSRVADRRPSIGPGMPLLPLPALALALALALAQAQAQAQIHAQVTKEPSESSAPLLPESCDWRMSLTHRRERHRDTTRGQPSTA